MKLKSMEVLDSRKWVLEMLYEGGNRWNFASLIEENRFADRFSATDQATREMKQLRLKHTSNSPSRRDKNIDEGEIDSPVV